jgi:carbon-monoxide dehydrogenase medium subunit
MLTAIRVPLLPSGSGGAYEKFAHPASRFAIVGTAAVLTLSGGEVSGARIGITGVAATAFRAEAVEAALLGKAPDEAGLAAAAAKATQGQTLRSDPRMSEVYCRSLAVTITRRALVRAAKRATA